jgi:hypothetical protein
MPGVVPAPEGGIVETKLNPVSWSELLNGPTQFALGLFPTTHKLPVNFAGASGGTLLVPCTCCCHPVSSEPTVVFCDATMALP